MARTYGDLWPQIIAFDSLLAAWKRTAAGRWRQHDVIAFKAQLEPNLIEIQESLLHKTYRTGPYKRFFVYEPKKREVASLPLKDRVVQHSLVAAIEPIFEARFIDQSFACRPGKGAHRGADLVQRYLREVKREHGAVYALKMDIAKYFPSVSHDALRRIIARRITCPDTLWLIGDVLASAADEGALLPRGIPIGNLAPDGAALPRGAHDVGRDRPGHNVVGRPRAPRGHLQPPLQGAGWRRLRAAAAPRRAAARVRRAP